MKVLFICLLAIVFVSCTNNQPTLQGITFGTINIQGDDTGMFTETLREQILLGGGTISDQGSLKIEGQLTWITYLNPQTKKLYLRDLTVYTKATDQTSIIYSAAVKATDRFEKVSIISGHISKEQMREACAKSVVYTFGQQTKARASGG